MTTTIEEVKRDAEKYGLGDSIPALYIEELQAFAQRYIEIGRKKASKDAERWKYTQQKGYFCCGPYSTEGDFLGYSVGVKPEIPPNLHWKDLPKYGNINKWTQGRGETLQDAIDEAIRNNTGE